MTLVVLVIAALGLGGWVVLAAPLGPGGQATGTPTTQPGTPPTSVPSPIPPSQDTPSDPPYDPMTAAVPFDPTTGLTSTYDYVSVLGVWGVGGGDFVAVVRVANRTTGDTVRGYDIHSGETLWTLSHLPDGSAFTASSLVGRGTDEVVALASGGKLALMLYGRTDPGTWCPATAYLAIVSLRTGDVSAIRSLGGVGSTDDSGTVVCSLVSLAAYQDNIVVTYGWQSSTVSPEISTGTFVATTAYTDTDLATPLWTVDGTYDLGPNTQILWQDTDKVLWDRLVLTSGGWYADLRDGTESAFSINPDADAPAGRAFHMAGGAALEFTGSTDLQGMAGALQSWASPTAAVPAWTYRPDPGNWVYPYAWCTSPDLLVGTIVGGSTQEVAVSLRDGSVLWAITGAVLDVNWFGSTSCLIDTTGASPVVLFAGHDGQSRTYDAYTGAGPSYTDSQGATPVAGVQYGVQPCAYGLACIVYITGDTGPVMVVAVDGTNRNQPVVAWTVSLGTVLSPTGHPAMYPVPGGVVVVGYRDDGTYVFLNLAGK